MSRDMGHDVKLPEHMCSFEMKNGLRKVPGTIQLDGGRHLSVKCILKFSVHRI